MKMVKVRFNKSGPLAVATGKMDGSVITIKPGMNEIPAEKWELVTSHPDIKKRLEDTIVDSKRGMVKVFEIIGCEAKKSAGKKDDEKDQDESDGLGDLKQGDAKGLVAETFDTELLRSWLESETRKGVKVAIEKQLESIEAERAESDSQE